MDTEGTAASPVPVMTTWLPPWRGPDAGRSEVMVGAATKVNRSKAPDASVPPAEVTVTSTCPAGAAGAAYHDQGPASGGSLVGRDARDPRRGGEAGRQQQVGGAAGVVDLVAV